MVVFGGEGAVVFGYRDETWSFSLFDQGFWTRIATGGTPPEPRSEHSTIYDPTRDRMIVFGGFSTSSQYLNDTWMLDLKTLIWSPLVTAGPLPPVRAGHATIYDPVRDRMIVFGGKGATDLQDLWELSLSGTPTWSALAATGAPPTARSSHSMIYDPTADRLLIFGGLTGSSMIDLWELRLSGTPSWQSLSLSPAPRIQWDHTAVYDPRGPRMLVFGGVKTTGATTNELWSLELSGVPRWVQLAPSGTRPSSRRAHTAIYDPDADRLIVLGGWPGNENSLLWSLAFDRTPTSVSVQIPSASLFIRPNPALSGRATVSFTLADAGQATLDLLDIAGRRIWTEEVGRLGSGTHVRPLVPGLTPGLYVLRLTSRQGTATARAVIVD